MSKIPDFVQGIHMPAMKNKTGAPLDLMRPGNGTPWEDRGSTGAVGAYFKTVIKSLFSPALLMDHIRRPETTNDSRVFAIISAAMWVIGVVGYNIYWLYWVLPKGQTPYVLSDPTFYWLTVLIQVLLVGGGIFAWLKIGPRLFRSLGATELKGAQPTLISNCFNCTTPMGPSILAIVPVYGWALAIIWILVDLVVAAKRRLYMKFTGAVINVAILMFLALGIAVVCYLFLSFVWGGSWFEMNGLTRKPDVVHKVATPTEAR